MSISFYTGAAGMRAFQSAMDVTAHNIANVNTSGYKTRRASFESLLYSRMATNVQGNHLSGHGVRQETVDQLMGQAGLDQTGLMLDFAIVGEGYFRVDNGGETEYTRNGAFYLSIEGGNATLVTNDGAYVLDRNGNRINLTIDANGSYSTADLTQRLGVYSFPNQYGLDPRNNARFAVSDNSGEAVLMAPGGGVQSPYEIVQGALEFSSVDLTKEMVDVISSQRAFQMNSRVVQTADQLADIVNNLR